VKAVIRDDDRFGQAASQFYPAQTKDLIGFCAELRAEDFRKRDKVRKIVLKRMIAIGCFVLLGLAATGCQKKPVAQAASGMQAMPVQTVAVTFAPVAQSSEYEGTIKSRRSATLLPQVSGMLTKIVVRSGDHVKAGQLLMEIDPRQQMATVASGARPRAPEESPLRLQRDRARTPAQAL